MDSKKRVLAAINRQKSDRIPLDGDFRQDVWTKLEGSFREKIFSRTLALMAFPGIRSDPIDAILCRVSANPESM